MFANIVRSARRARITLITFCASLLTIFAFQAHSATYPNMPIRIVVPFPAGGVTDIVARTLANDLGKQFGSPVIVENKPGASATIGARYVANQNPDGYTLLVGTNGTHGTNVSTFANLGYDAERDFVPVTMLGETSLMILVHDEVPADNLQEFVSALKSGEFQASYGSTGVGGGVHLITELFLTEVGASMQHVPYKGSSHALTDLMGKHIDVMFDNIASSLNLVQEGKLKALAVTGTERSDLIPNTPSVKETGVADFVAGNWLGVYAPAGTSQNIVDKLNQAINTALRNPDVANALTKAGFVPAGGSADEFRERTRQEIEKWALVTEKIGLQPQ